ncbi:MAG TPA: DUF2784 domain-containing protein [Acidobacteriaceae bacterium]|nr:DUF2784 domain-containing protein [Acidobacteriaceae bacterium]
MTWTWAQIDNAAVVAVLMLHLAWILWVIFGAFWTSGRPWLTAFHIASLVWGILVEIGPWPCPLTMAEEFFQQRAGQVSSGGNFLQHYISSIVYPNVSVTLLIGCGVAVCAANLAIYAWRAFRWIRRRPSVS